PITIDFAVLYSNRFYLNKYNKTIPKTWNDLLETSKYIKEREDKDGKKDFMFYNGLFNPYEVGTCSLYEFIFSYRNSPEAPFPEITSKEAVESLKMMKKLKEGLNADHIFKSNDDISVARLFDINNKKGQFLFIKYWYLPFDDDEYNITALPGNIEGVSGSAIGGPNLGISIPDLYNDPDVCAAVNCEFFKSIQLTARPTDKADDYNSYSEKFRNYIYEFLYGNKSPEEALKNINDISKFYYLSIKNENTLVGEITTLKCQFQVLLLSLGFTFSIIPILYILIVNFPEGNMVSHYVFVNKYPFVLLFLLLDILLNSLSFNKPFKLTEKIIDHGQNFKICQISKFGNFQLGTLFSIKIIIMVFILFFIFIEWNIEKTRLDIRFLSAAIYMDIVSIGVILIVSYMDLSNYIAFYGIPIFIYIFFAITNYSLFYGYRIIRAYKSYDNEVLYINSFGKNSSSNDNIYYYNSNGKLNSLPNTSSNRDYANYSGNSNDVNVPNKIYNYHYRKNNTSDLLSQSSNSLPGNSRSQISNYLSY
ncbi:hypothetical protein PIROE2DRAFT_12196, partial [Piromyces sp. E2]